MSRDELAALMGVSTKTVDRWRRRGMPSETWGIRTRRFKPSVAIAWARSRPELAECAEHVAGAERAA